MAQQGFEKGDQRNIVDTPPKPVEDDAFFRSIKEEPQEEQDEVAQLAPVARPIDSEVGASKDLPADEDTRAHPQLKDSNPHQINWQHQLDIPYHHQPPVPHFAHGNPAMNNFGYPSFPQMPIPATQAFFNGPGGFPFPAPAQPYAQPPAHQSPKLLAALLKDQEKEKIVDLKAQVKKLQEEKEKLQQENRRLEGRAEAAEKKQEEQKKEMEMEKKKMKDELDQEKKRINDEMEKEKKRMGDLNGIALQLKSDMEAKVKESELRNQDLIQKLENSKKETSNLKKKLEDSENLTSHLQQTVSSHDSEIKTLKKALKDQAGTSVDSEGPRKRPKRRCTVEKK
uniref:Enterophilin-2L n=1 Tax=Caenorhabditis tropicalis TaxID=1561998 RepID=A0A1I7V3E6_9PELO